MKLFAALLWLLYAFPLAWALPNNCQQDFFKETDRIGNNAWYPFSAPACDAIGAPGFRATNLTWITGYWHPTTNMGHACLYFLNVGFSDGANLWFGTAENVPCTRKQCTGQATISFGYGNKVTQLEAYFNGLELAAFFMRTDDGQAVIFGDPKNFTAISLDTFEGDLRGVFGSHRSRIYSLGFYFDPRTMTPTTTETPSPIVCMKESEYCTMETIQPPYASQCSHTEVLRFFQNKYGSLCYLRPGCNVVHCDLAEGLDEEDTAFMRPCRGA